MADMYTSITDAAVLDADEVTQFESGILYGVAPELVMDQVATIQVSGAAKIFQFAKYANLSKITSGITDGEEVTSVVLADSTATLTPVDYGNVVSLLKIADLQSGNKALTAAGYLVGQNAGASLDGLAVTAAEAFTTTVIFPGSNTAIGTCGETDNLDKTFANRLYNKLARTNVQKINGQYIGVAHDDCLFDLRDDTSTGGWIDVQKYADPSSALMNEVGMYAGIRWLRSSNVTVTADGASGTVDSYKVNVFGYNAIGKGESLPLTGVVSGPFDKLQRVLHIGWNWVGAYGVIDTAKMVQGGCTSSIGSN